MIVEVEFLSFSSNPAIPTSFTDALDNSTGKITGPQNLAAVNNFNWVWTAIGWDSIFSSPVSFNSYGMGQPLSGGGGTGLVITQSQMGANPPYTVCNGIAPIPLLPVTGKFRSAFYTNKIKFVQFTINAFSNGVCGAGLMNFEDLSGTGAGSNQIAHDAYFLQGDGGLRRDNSGATFSQLHNGVAFVQGDVWRMGMDASNAAQTVITVSRNGTVNYTITDANVNRLTGNAFPFIGIVNNTNGFTGEMKLFSCGLGA